jgi:hypothetical protein
MSREVDVKRARVDKSGPIRSDSSGISSSVTLPPSHHPTLPPPLPQQSGTPTVPALVTAHVSLPVGSQPYPAPHFPPPISTSPQSNPSITYPVATRPPTTPIHAQPPGPSPPGAAGSFHSYGPVIPPTSRINSQDHTASRPSTATGQPDPHRPEWTTSTMEPPNGVPRHAPPPPAGYPPHHGIEPQPMDGLPTLAGSGPPLAHYPGPVQPPMEHYQAVYPQTPGSATFPGQYATGPANYAMAGKPRPKGARAQQVHL